MLLNAYYSQIIPAYYVKAYRLAPNYSYECEFTIMMTQETQK